MLFALVIFNLASNGAQALPILPGKLGQSLCHDLDHCRTIWNILWSCLLTISSCTWVTMHPNVPAPDDSEFIIIFRRINLLLIALVAPELIVLWAIRQWIVAREMGRWVRRSVNWSDGKYWTTDKKEREWTLAHGFMVSMGGFMLSYDEQLQHPLNWRVVDDLVRMDYIDIAVTEKEINDKSKGDMVSKGLVILQTTWFAMQCIARGIQRLPVTELEFVTLAFVTLNAVIYASWWNKPLDVKYPIPVTLKRTISDEDWVKFDWLFGSVRPSVVDGILAEGEEEKEEKVKGSASKDGSRDVEGEEEKVKDSASKDGSRDVESETEVAIKPGPRELEGHGERGIFRKIAETTRHGAQITAMFLTGSQDDRYNLDLTLLKRVPTLYAGALSTYQHDRNANIAFAVVAIIFGSIHCIPWSSSFPSHAEEVLWRTSCIVVTCVPGVYLIIYAGAALFMRAVELPRLQPVFNIVMPPLLLLYFIARVSLFVLAFISLRSLPTGAYDDVNWAKFIPHI